MEWDTISKGLAMAATPFVLLFFSVVLLNPVKRWIQRHMSDNWLKRLLLTKIS